MCVFHLGISVQSHFGCHGYDFDGEKSSCLVIDWTPYQMGLASQVGNIYSIMKDIIRFL